MCYNQRFILSFLELSINGTEQYIFCIWLFSLSKMYLSFAHFVCQPTPVLLPGKSHGQRSLEGYSPWGHKESDMTEQLHFHFSLSCIGEGNGNALQCSCLENPRDGGAWWAAVYGAAQSRTRLKRFSSSKLGSEHCRGRWEERC